jgi:hypothetical protein
VLPRTKALCWPILSILYIGSMCLLHEVRSGTIPISVQLYVAVKVSKLKCTTWKHRSRPTTMHFALELNRTDAFKISSIRIYEYRVLLTVKEHLMLCVHSSLTCDVGFVMNLWMYSHLRDTSHVLFQEDIRRATTNAVSHLNRVGNWNGALRLWMWNSKFTYYI